MDGTLYGVGVGPGDPELLTLKAINTIRRCGVIAAPDAGAGEQLALRIAEEYLQDKELLLCPMPMTRDAQVQQHSHRICADMICTRLRQGEDVAFLTLGDPGIYATYSYLHRLVTASGFEAVIVPGVTSFCAAAAALGQPLCEGEQPLQILPASWHGLPQALAAEGTKVIMKMGRSRANTLRLLERMDLLEHASLVERCTMPDEVVHHDVTGLPEGIGYFATVVVREEA